MMSSRVRLKAKRITRRAAELDATYSKTTPSKQEDKNLPNINDSSYYCEMCEITCSSRIDYKHHLKRTHSIKLKKTADTDNTFHCRICNLSFITQAEYKAHLKSISSIQQGSIGGLHNISKSSYHCNICNINQNNLRSYQRHCQKVHGIHFWSGCHGPYANPDILPDPTDTNNYCRTCDRTFGRQRRYLYHLKCVHRVEHHSPSTASIKASGSREKQMPPISNLSRIFARKLSLDSDNLPDPNDPDFFCQSCKITKESLKKYRSHCKNVHGVKVSRKVDIRYPNAIIDIHHANFYCAKCDRYSKSKSRFSHHLRKYHDFEKKQLA